MAFNHGFALLIGVAKYANPHIPSLPETVLNDARDLAALLQRPERAGYKPKHVRVLLDAQATREGILDGLRWLARRAGAQDTAVVFFSGHGGRVDEGPQRGNYLLPFDTDPTDPQSTAISSDQLTAALSAIRTQKLLVLIDACHSGGSADLKDIADRSGILKRSVAAEMYDVLKRGSGRVILASSRPEEFSYVLPGAPNSLFTQCLLEALDGKAGHDGEGHIRIFDVVAYVFREVAQRAAAVGGTQHPIFKVDMMDDNFVVALYRGGEKSAQGITRTEARDLLRLLDMSPMAPADEVVAVRDFLAQRLTLGEMEMLCADVHAALARAGYDIPLDLETVGAVGVS
ncbi:MAG: caspase family protein, partial [Thermoflexales bacterium]|nr:caspase family protein [Thermoflexales bacterium]